MLTDGGHGSGSPASDGSVFFVYALQAGKSNHHPEPANSSTVAVDDGFSCLMTEGQREFYHWLSPPCSV